MKLKCPKCKSLNIKTIEYMGKECILCKDCNYDESELYDVYPEEKSSQKAKGRYSPYKKGGHGRGT